MLGRLYYVVFNNVAVTVQQSLFYIKPAADKICVIEKVILAASGGNADAGDAQEELYEIGIRFVPATVTASSGGSSVTPVPNLVNDAAAGFTARTNDTTKTTSSGTILTRVADGWNSRVPYLWEPQPEHRIVVANAAALDVVLNTTPADSILLNGSIAVRELP
jgi:hypothetical protein